VKERTKEEQVKVIEALKGAFTRDELRLVADCLYRVLYRDQRGVEVPALTFAESLPLGDYLAPTFSQAFEEAPEPLALCMVCGRPVQDHPSALVSSPWPLTGVCYR